MITRKISVFLLVIAFHLVILGVVYFVTKEDKASIVENNNKKDTENVDSADKTPVENSDSNNSNDTNNNSNNNNPLNKGYVFHTVAKGDFLSKIAEKYKVSPQEIMTLNNIKDQNKILLGQKLKIPVK